MPAKNLVVFGMFKDRMRVEQAVTVLRQAGFRVEDISVLMAENAGTKEFALKKGTKAPEGAAAGAGAGAAIGGTLGLLAGLGMLAIPGLGPIIAAGPIMGALAGLGVGGAVGGLAGALVGMGIPEYEAKRYEGLIKKGGILMSVHCDDRDWMHRCKDLMEQIGAEDISTSSEAGADYAESDRPMPV
jgi:hypothetical protein